MAIFILLLALLLLAPKLGLIAVFVIAACTALFSLGIKLPKRLGKGLNYGK